MPDNPLPADQAFGAFVGDIVAKWTDDARRMELVEEFAYLDGDNRRWDAPKGSLIDGASIPRALWTLVGSPFTGEYRNASVVHDVWCVRRTRSWRAVHRMFYEAMRCGGVGEKRALFMYAAVFQFGPRWVPARTILGDAFAMGPRWAPQDTQQPSEVTLEQLRALIEETDQVKTTRDVHHLMDEWAPSVG